MLRASMSYLIHSRLVASGASEPAEAAHLRAVPETVTARADRFPPSPRAFRRNHFQCVSDKKQPVMRTRFLNIVDSY